jgi:predicted amidophosphoribosyltransferase
MLSLVKREKTMDSEEYFDTILNKRYRNMCHRCGNYQSHSLRWCKQCGGEFCQHEHTLIEAIEIMSRFVPKRPEFIAAVHKRKIEAMGYSAKDFEEYIKSKLLLQ